MADTTQTAFRLPKQLLARLDKYAVTLEQQNPGMTVTRADAVRMLLTRALGDVEKSEAKQRRK